MAAAITGRAGQPSAVGGALTKTAWAAAMTCASRAASRTSTGSTPSAAIRASSSGRRKLAAIDQPWGRRRFARA